MVAVKALVQLDGLVAVLHTVWSGMTCGVVMCCAECLFAAILAQAGVDEGQKVLKVDLSPQVSYVRVRGRVRTLWSRLRVESRLVHS